MSTSTKWPVAVFGRPEPSADSSLVVFRVEYSGSRGSGGRLALIAGEGLGNWNVQAARLGVNHPRGSGTWYIPIFVDLNGSMDYTVVECQLVKLDSGFTVLERDPVGKRMWVVPPGDSAYTMRWGTPDGAEYPWKDLPTKESDGVDLTLTAWTSHVVGYIKSLNLPSHAPYDFSSLNTSRFKLMKHFVYHPDDQRHIAIQEQRDVTPQRAMPETTPAERTVSLDLELNPDESASDNNEPASGSDTLPIPPWLRSDSPEVRKIKSQAEDSRRKTSKSWHKGLKNALRRLQSSHNTRA